jgi:hypothetical protein
VNNLGISSKSLFNLKRLTRSFLISTLEAEGVRDFIPYGQTIFKGGGLRSCPINVQLDLSKMSNPLRIVSPSNIWVVFSAHIFFRENLLK